MCSDSTLVHVEENGRCSTDHIIQWRINRSVILYKEYNPFSNTNNNKNLASTLFSYPGNSSSVLVYTGFRNSATILTLLWNSTCSVHVIQAQILLDGLCFGFAKFKRFVGLVQKKIFVVLVRLSLAHRDFSSFSEYFDGVMNCRWWDLQSLCNLTWQTLFLKYSTIFLRTLPQIGEPLPIFTLPL